MKQLFSESAAKLSRGKLIFELLGQAMVAASKAAMKVVTLTAMTAPALAVANPQDTIPAPQLTISAAASFKEALDEIKTTFVHNQTEVQPKIYINYAGSGTLALQIINGAAVDIFISADEKSMLDVKNKGDLENGSIFQLCQNALVAVSLKNQDLALGDNSDIASVLQSAQVKRIALGNTKTVPAGRYAQEALLNAGLFKQLEPKFIYTQNVRQALSYVLKGEVDVALVYSSDYFIHQDKLQQILELPTVTPIAAYAALVKLKAEPDDREQQKHQAQIQAQIDLRHKFMEFLKSAPAQAVFKKYGFKVELQRPQSTAEQPAA